MNDMQINKTLSLNSVVVEEFEREVNSGDRSRVIEAMMIRFLMKYSKEERSVSPPKIKTSLAKSGVK